MKQKASFWQKIGLHDWFLKGGNSEQTQRHAALTPNDVYKYILDKFTQSIGELSFADRIVFYHEYIICFNPDDYKDFMDNKKGIFGLIVQESVKKFYAVLKSYKESGKTVEPSSSKWVFRFVSHPDYLPGDKSFIGKLLPGTANKEENLRVTYIPRQTGIAQTFDVNPDILQGFTFYSEGYYEVPYGDDLMYDGKLHGGKQNANGYARLEAVVPDKEMAGKKIEYIMKDEEILVSGKDEKRDTSNIFRVPSDWVNTPHLRIKYNKEDSKFYLTSFGEKTIVNEKQVTKSNVASPVWTELPLNSRIVINGIVGINLFKV